MSERQYLALTGPILVAAAAETITQDKWAPPLPSPVRRIAATALLVAACVAPLHVPDVTDPVTPTSWRSNSAYPDRIHRIVLPRAAHLVFAQNIDPIPIIFSEPGGGTISTGASRLWQYLALVGPLDVPVVAETVLNWQPIYPDRSRAIPALITAGQRAYSADRFDAPDAAAAATPLSWVARYPDRLAVPSRHALQGQTFTTDAQWTPTPSADDRFNWRPLYPDRPIVRQPLAQHVWAQPHFAVEVDVPVMSWTGLYLDPPMRPKPWRSGLQSVSPLYLADITAIAPEQSWQGRYPDRFPAKARAAEGRTDAPVFVADVTAGAPFLSGRAIYPDRVWAKVGLQASARPAFTFDAQWTAPTPATVPSPADGIFPDRVDGKARPTIHPDLAAPIYVLDVTVVSPALSWQPSYPDRIRIRARVAQQQVFTTDTQIPMSNFKVWWARFNTYTGPWDRDPT